MVRVELARIVIDEKKKEQVIVLRDPATGAQVPIVVGFVEATSIHLPLTDVVPPRPMTHDFILHLISALDAKPDRLLIDDLVDGTFFAKLRLKTKDDLVVIDCRPSDGIALAVRAQIPIFVDEIVMAKTTLAE